MNAPQALDAPLPVRFTVEDFLLLDRSGAFDRAGKTELINGTILQVNAQYSEHYKVKNRLYRRLADACDALERGLEARSEGSIGMEPANVPEPDLFITDVEPTRGLTPPSTVVLVAEVSVTTLRFDLVDKAQLYAANGISEYWVIDVEGRAIHQLWTPGCDGYADRREVALGQRVEAVTIPGLGVETGGL